MHSFLDLVRLVHYYAFQEEAGYADIARLGNVLIRMFADDHNPPHFHVVTPDGEALVLLSDLSVLAGAIDRRSLEVVREWATMNRGAMSNEWRRLNER